MAIQQIQTALASHPDIRLAYVFGSVAQVRGRSDSDVDAAAQIPKPLGSTLRMQLIEELALATGRPVDLIDRQTGRWRQNGTRAIDVPVRLRHGRLRAICDPQYWKS